MRSRPAALLFLAGLALCRPAEAVNRSSHAWDEPRKVDRHTRFFGEPFAPKPEPAEPPPAASKEYAWQNLQKGDSHYLNREYEKAALYFKAAYAVAGPTRVLSGFRLIDAYDKLDWADLALGVLDEMEKKYLVSTREFAEARRLRLALEDKKRRGLKHAKIEPFAGRDWLKQLSEWRKRWVLGAMDELRRHGVPMKEEAQRYIFLLEEYFIANPELPAYDSVAAFSEFLYRREVEARLAIDRWRSDPEGTLTEEAKALDEMPVRLTGADWITLTHEDKLEYVEGAIAVLKEQRVPMKKGAYAYTDALDMLFTEDPQLPAADSVVALASLLHRTEPDARDMLDALRLK